MMKPFNRILAMSLALAAIPHLTSAQAAPGPQERERSGEGVRGVGLGDVRKADKDSDGVVSKEEFTAMVQETMFARMDANADGKIDDTELKRLDELREMARERFGRGDGPGPEGRRPQGPPPGAPGIGPDGVTPNAPRPEYRERIRDDSMGAFQKNLEISQIIMKELDANGDGKLGKDEAPDRVLAAFEKLDTNKDGVLDSNDAGLEKNLKDRERDRGAMMGGLFDRMDANGDGKIEMNEAPPRIQEQFASVDKNGDGGLDKEELKAMRPEGLLPRKPGRDKGGPSPSPESK